MNTLKTVFVVAVLAVVGYGVYATLNQADPVEPPSWLPPDAQSLAGTSTPTVEMPGVETDSLSSSYSGTPLGGPPPTFTHSTTEAASTDSDIPDADVANVGTANPASSVQNSSYTDANYSGLKSSAAYASDAATESAAGATNPGDQYANTATASDTYATDANASTHSVQSLLDRQAQNAALSGGGGIRASDTAFTAAMTAAQQQLDEGEKSLALLTLSNLYSDTTLTESQQATLHELLDHVAGEVIYSRESITEPPYVVRSGDRLSDIAEIYQVTPQLLAKINGIANPDQLAPGTELKVIRGPFHALVDVKQKTLTLMVGPRYAGRFPISLGPDFATDDYQFVIQGKKENPRYFGPDGGEVVNGMPQHPWGNHWLGLEPGLGRRRVAASDTGSKLGIHGTNTPEAITQGTAAGSIALQPRDAEDVFDILAEGARVTIKR